MIQKKTLVVKGLYTVLQARHLLFYLKQETGRELPIRTTCFLV